MAVVDTAARSAADAALLAAIPASARRVLELGCGTGALGRQFKAAHPGVTWWGVDASFGAVAAAAPHLDRAIELDPDRGDLATLDGGHDVLVVGDLLPHLRDPARVLEALYDLAAPDALIVCRVPNAGHLSTIERLVAGDASVVAGAVPDARPYTPASLFKQLLDAGWLPNLAQPLRSALPEAPFTAHLLDAALALGLPAETALRQLALREMVVTGRKWPMQWLARGARPVPFSVIVPVNRPWQFELNVACSPGLAEVAADIVCIEGAPNAAAAYAEGARRARHDWHLFVHQDVYFPVGSGYAIAQQLGAVERTDVPVGFAGIAAEGAAERPAGLVIDRTALFRHGPSRTAVSLDEFAVALHRASPLRLEAALGWHLWATDLCLQARARAGAPAAHILDVPLFHNSTTGYTLPAAFHDSARTLMARHAGLAQVTTLCGRLSRAPGTADAVVSL